MTLQDCKTYYDSSLTCCIFAVNTNTALSHRLWIAWLWVGRALIDKHVMSMTKQATVNDSNTLNLPCQCQWN